MECEDIAKKNRTNSDDPYKQFDPIFVEESDTNYRLLKLNDRILAAYDKFLDANVDRQDPSELFPPIPKDILNRILVLNQQN